MGNVARFLGWALAFILILPPSLWVLPYLCGFDPGYLYAVAIPLSVPFGLHMIADEI